jgi:hypothetical protein
MLSTAERALSQGALTRLGGARADREGRDGRLDPKGVAG